MKRTFTLLTLLLSGSLVANAQIYFNFDTAAPTSNSETNISVDSVRHGNNNGTTALRTTSAASNNYPEASGTWNAGAAAFTGGFDPANSTYFEVVLDPQNGNSVVLTGISFGSRSTSTGPQAFAVRSSVDNFAGVLTTGSLNNNSSWSNTGVLPMTLAGVAGIPVILRIYGFNGSGNPSANTANWRIDDLTLYTVTLPITLVSFDGTVNGDQVKLQWVTGTEVNADRFEIEKGTDGLRFETIGSLAAKNENSSTYSFEDKLSNASYYRLKMVDKDGSFAYSKVLNLRATKGGAVTLFPNPAREALYVQLPANAQALIKVYAVDGRTVMTHSANTASGPVKLDIGNLHAGSYFLEVDQGSERSSFKFFKN